MAATPASSQEFINHLRERRAAKRTGGQPMNAAAAQSAAPTTQAALNPQDVAELFPGMNRPIPEETVLEWTAPSRPFKKRQRQYYTTIVIIVVLICLILFFAGQFLPIAVVLAAAFMAFVLASVPPEMIGHKITTYGLRVDNQLYYWDELGRFWLDQKYDQHILHVEVYRFPFRLTILLGEQKPEEMTSILSEVLLNQKPPLTALEKVANWLQEKIPLETSH